jgi:hypothetical protein
MEIWKILSEKKIEKEKCAEQKIKNHFPCQKWVQ